jgi:hypothetical protein
MDSQQFFIRRGSKVPSVLEGNDGCTTYQEARRGLLPDLFGSMTGRANGTYLSSSADRIIVLKDGGTNGADFRNCHSWEKVAEIWPV